MKDEVRVLAERLEGCSLEDEDILTEIEESLREYLKSTPTDPDARTVYGEVLVRLDREDEAELILRAVLNEDPFHTRATSRLGRLLDSSLRCDEAEQLFRRVLSERPHSHILVDDLCRLLYGEGRIEEALSTARQHIEGHPGEPVGYNALRYLLVVLEDELESEMLDNLQDPSRLMDMLENFLQQYDLVSQVERALELQQQVCTTIDWDVDEEVLRLASEIEDVYKRVKAQSINLTPDQKSQVERALAERDGAR